MGLGASLIAGQAPGLPLPEPDPPEPPSCSAIALGKSFHAALPLAANLVF